MHTKHTRTNLVGWYDGGNHLWRLTLEHDEAVDGLIHSILVFILAPKTLAWLGVNDAMALAQARQAIADAVEAGIFIPKETDTHT